MPNNNILMGQNGFWCGIVEDRADPLNLSRVRVRMFGIHTHDKMMIKTEDLPWASVLIPVTDGVGSSGLGSGGNGIAPGTTCMGIWRDNENMQDPIVLGCLIGIPSIFSDPFTGFNDPRTNLENEPYIPESLIIKDDGSGTIINEVTDRKNYPTVVKEADTSRLTRGITEGTIVEQKNNTLDSNVPLSSEFSLESLIASIPQVIGSLLGIDLSFLNSFFGSINNTQQTYSQPASPYDAKYPFNKSFMSESGNLTEIDDTPGAERIHEYHRSGTFREIAADGTTVQKIANDNYKITLRDDFIHIEGKSSETVDKGSKLLVNKDAEAGNNFDIQIGANGNLNVSLDKGDVNLLLKEGNLSYTINGNVNEIISGNKTTFIGGNRVETILGNDGKAVGGNVIELVTMNKTTTILGFLNVNVIGGILQTVLGSIVRFIGKDYSEFIADDRISESGGQTTINGDPVSINDA